MPLSNNVRKVTSENYPTDSGREGELIFRLVYQQAGCKKPFSRLWLSSMEENAIREGFAHLKPSTEYDALYNAALCRERADWMVGINCSRLFSCLYGQLLAVGRVMTPVLAMTVVRKAAIAAFGINSLSCWWPSSSASSSFLVQLPSPRASGVSVSGWPNCKEHFQSFAVFGRLFLLWG